MEKGFAHPQPKETKKYCPSTPQDNKKYCPLTPQRGNKKKCCPLTNKEKKKEKKNVFPRKEPPTVLLCHGGLVNKAFIFFTFPACSFLNETGSLSS